MYVCRWVWMEAGTQPDVEDSVGIGGFGYPVIILRVKLLVLTFVQSASGVLIFNL